MENFKNLIENALNIATNTTFKVEIKTSTNIDKQTLTHFQINAFLLNNKFPIKKIIIEIDD